MSDNRQFRSSVGGFNKQDVNEYILEINRRFNESREEYESQKVALKAKIGDLEAANSALNEEITAANTALQTAREDAASTDERLRAAEAEIEALRGQLEAIPESAFHEDPSDPDSESRKAELYDKISSQVGDIMINASRNAEEIIRRAEETAEKMISEGENKISASKEHMRDVMRTVISNLNGDMRTSTEACIREFRDYVEAITSSSKVLVADLEKKYSEMNQRIAYYQSTLEENVGEHIKRLDSEIKEN